MNALHLSSSAVGGLSGFIAKQCVTYYSLDTVREQLQLLITKVANNYFGNPLATFIGNQAGVAFSIPVTCLFADLVGSAVKETIQTVVYISTTLLIGKKPCKNDSFFKELGIKIARFTTYFFSKSYFCNYCMPFVKQGIEFCLKHVVTLSITAIPVAFTTSLAVSTLAIVIAAPLTFLLGDLIGYAVSELTSELCTQISQYL